MAVFTNIDLKKKRELLKMTAADLAEKIGRDPTTIYNWEAGKSDPDPDTVYQIAEVFGSLQIWYDWMRTKFTSYARMHPECHDYDLPGAIMRMYAESSDVMDMKREVLRDGADGVIDNNELKTELKKELDEMLVCAQKVRMLLKGGHSDGKSVDG